MTMIDNDYNEHVVCKWRDKTMIQFIMIDDVQVEVSTHNIIVNVNTMFTNNLFYFQIDYSIDLQDGLYLQIPFLHLP